MMIEIRQAGFLNKGAELMLYSILQELKKNYPDAKFVMAPNVVSLPYEKVTSLGFYLKAELWKYRIQWLKPVSLLPKKLRKMYGIVIDKEIDVVIDTAGFAYSDQWGSRSSYELASSCKSWKKNGTKVILLPQAFGPFTSKSIKKYIHTIANNADLIFAREQISYQNLIDIVGERDNVKLSPDFTNLIKGVVPKTFDKSDKSFCIIPNYRMIDKTSKEESKAYLPFLIRCTKYLLKKQQKPFILVHEGKDDMQLAQNISDAVGGIPIVQENDTLKIKGIIGMCEGTIGSRFHGLVSALSQGVPSIATGWSHKYKMLFEDYDFNEGLMSVLASDEEIYKKIDLIIDDPSKSAIKATLIQKSSKLKKDSRSMWHDVINCIGDK